MTAVSKTAPPAAALSNARLHDDGLLLTLLGEHQPEICYLTPHLAVSNAVFYKAFTLQNHTQRPLLQLRLFIYYLKEAKALSNIAYWSVWH